MRLFNTPSFITYLLPFRTWRKNTQGKKLIYLTFDDGPLPEITEWILECLKKYEAKATFFCVGDNIKKHENIFQKTIKEGHQVGNHTFNHLNCRKNDLKSYLQNIQECKEIMKENHSGLFRPPYGRLTSKASKLLKKQGYEIIMWSVLTYDFDKNLSAELCLKNAIKYTKEGSIVVFHDLPKSFEKVKKVLPDFLEYFTEKGFLFEKLPNFQNG
jgi:peptidoglycan/xylan/chitin deacetylase (PgdA/CDA1 family)